jgi:hypothetical protein
LRRSDPCRGSSVVEQGTHKPLVGSPNLPLGTTRPPNPVVLLFIQLDQALNGENDHRAQHVE